MTHQPFKGVRASGTPRGFNRASASVTTNRDGRGNTIGHHFACYGCGMDRNYRLANFHDTYGAAVHALNSHHCITDKKG